MMQYVSASLDTPCSAFQSYVCAVDEEYYYTALNEAEKGGVVGEPGAAANRNNSVAERLGLAVCTYTLLCVGSKLLVCVIDLWYAPFAGLSCQSPPTFFPVGPTPQCEELL